MSAARGAVKVRRRPSGFGCLLPALLTAVLSGCSETSAPSSDIFGQVGRIQIDVQSPIGSDGQRNEILIWASNGPWLFTERVSYGGNVGAETGRSSQLNPGDLAREYSSLILQLNRTPGIRILDGTVPQGLDPLCGEGGLPPTRVAFTIRDDVRDEEATWVRCAVGTFLPPPNNTISPASAAPDAGAARVITAAQLTKSFTLGESYASTYGGTHPFSVLAQGEDSPARRGAPVAFVSTDGDPPPAFVDFWEDHAGVGAPLPAVDWAAEAVLLLAVGRREEVGEALRVKRVLPLGPASGTRVEVTERVPGDFCSPLARSIYPYQLVIVPIEGVYLPVEFTAPQLERIPCGS